MRIRFLKNWCGEVQKTSLNETWDISCNKWTEFRVESIQPDKRIANITKTDRDVLLKVPVEVYEVIP